MDPTGCKLNSSTAEVDQKLVTIGKSDDKKCLDLSALTFLLRINSIVFSCNASKSSIYLNYFFQFYMFCTSAAMFICNFYLLRNGDLNWWLVASSIWFFHSTLIYILISRSMLKNCGLLNILKVIIDTSPEELVKTTLVDPLAVQTLCKWGAVVVTTLSALNIILVALNYDSVVHLFPIYTRGAYYLSFVGQIPTTYIASFCYFLHLPFIMVPCHILTLKIKTLLGYIEETLPESITADDMLQCCRWFDCLNRKNNVVNDAIKPLVATTFCCFGILEIFLVLSLYSDIEIPDISGMVIWIVLSGCIVIFVAKYVGELEAQTGRYFFIIFVLFCVTSLTTLVVRVYCKII